jgi:hypothetical protein
MVITPLTYSEDAGLPDMGTKLVEQLAAKQPLLKTQSSDEDESRDQTADSLRFQYLLLRIALVGISAIWRDETKVIQAWKQHRLDLAEHFYSQIERSHTDRDSDDLLRLADLCYEIGSRQFDKNVTSLAIKWLRRGCDVTNCEEIRSGDANINDIRLALMHTHGRLIGFPIQGWLIAHASTQQEPSSYPRMNTK